MMTPSVPVRLAVLGIAFALRVSGTEPLLYEVSALQHGPGAAAGQMLATPSAAAEAAGGNRRFDAALATLSRQGVLRHTTYWRENARAGRTCSGLLVGRVILAAVQRIHPVDTLEQALEVLVARGVSRHSEYWRDHARKARSRCCWPDWRHWSPRRRKHEARLFHLGGRYPDPPALSGAGCTATAVRHPGGQRNR